MLKSSMLECIYYFLILLGSIYFVINWLIRLSISFEILINCCLILMLCCKLLIHRVAVNTKFTAWQHYSILYKKNKWRRKLDTILILSNTLQFEYLVQDSTLPFHEIFKKCIIETTIFLKFFKPDEFLTKVYLMIR